MLEDALVERYLVDDAIGAADLEHALDLLHGRKTLPPEELPLDLWLRRWVDPSSVIVASTNEDGSPHVALSMPPWGAIYIKTDDGWMTVAPTPSPGNGF